MVRGRRCAAPDNPAFCKKGSDHPSAKLFPLERSSRQVTMLDPKTMKYTLRRHLLRDPSPAVRLRRQRHAVAQRRRPGASAGSTPRCSTRPATRRSRRAGRRSSSTPTATASATSYVEPDQPLDPAKDKRIVPVGPLCGDAEPGRRLGLGHRRRVRRHPGASCASIPGQSAGTGSPRSTTCRCPAYGIRGGDIDKQRRRLGVARQRPPRQLRPAQVQGAAQRAERDRRSLPRGLGVLPVPGPGLRRASARTAPSRAITPGSTSTTRSGSARTCRCRPPTSTTASSRSRTAR